MSDTPPQGESTKVEVRGPRLYWRRLLRRPVTLVGTVIFLMFLLLAVIGPWIAPYPYCEQNPEARLEAPSVSHPFGTDQFGRDVFSRVLCGTRGVFILGGLGTGIAVVLGTVAGLLSGYLGGWWDEILMRIFDVLLCIPSLLLAMLLIATVGSSKANLVVVIAILYTPDVGRIVRSVVLDLRTKEFVEAAKLRHEKRSYVLFRELLPNATGPLVVETAMRFSYSIFLVASLGFLGLGVQPPAPDWGLLVNEARNFLSIAPWMLLFPAMAIALLIIGTNLMGDGIRQITAPAASRG